MLIVMQSMIIPIYLLFTYIGIKNKYCIGMIVLGVCGATILHSANIQHFKFYIVICYLFISFFISINKKKYINKEILLSLFLLLSFFLIILINSLYTGAVSTEYFKNKMIFFIGLSLLPALLILLNGKINVKECLFIEKFIIVNCLIFAIILFVNVILNYSKITTLQYFYRFSIGTINPIWLARFMGIGIIILQSKRYQERMIISDILTMFIFATALFTGSKILIFFVLPLGIILKFYSNKRIVLNFFSIFFIALFVIFSFTQFNYTGIQNRFSYKAASITYRVDNLFRTCLDSWIKSENYLLGNGFAAVAGAYPHNLFLEILYENGIIGLLIYCLPVVFSFFIFLKKGKNNWFFYGYILAILYSLGSGDLIMNNFIYLLFSLFIVSTDLKFDDIFLKRKKIIEK